MSDEQAMVDVAAFYNERACRNPSNPPTRRDVAAFAGVSPSTAQKWLEIGDAVATPDGEVWVVTGLATLNVLELVAASRGDGGLVYVDPYEQTKTTLPRDLVSKVADARKVRRS